MPRSGDEHWAYLNDVIVTAGALQPRLKPGIAMAMHRDRCTNASTSSGSNRLTLPSC
jgi:hypothetical protein